VDAEDFDARLDAIRRRFAARLAGRIRDAEAAIAALSSDAAACSDASVTLHRSMHELCGIAPTLGFATTGRAARAVERILREPSRTGRSLAPAELAALRRGLVELRAAARTEAAAYGLDWE
jgi:HPt (histidine-containing phosphotransfer) domain-containing protein